MFNQTNVNCNQTLLSFLLLIKCVWVWVYVYDVYALCVDVGNCTCRGQARTSDRLMYHSPPHSPDTGSLTLS